MSEAAACVQVHPLRAPRRMLCLLGGPYVVAGGRRYLVPEGSKRVLVFVALHGGRVDRRYLAGTLWPNGDDNRASGNLRSALWRLRCSGIDILDSDKCVVWLRPGSVVDIHALSDWAGRVIDGTATESDLHIPQWDPEAADLLPGWYDEWVLFERARLRQRLLHAMESLSACLTVLGRYAEAVEAALDAVDVEPLRESAHRALIAAHLAQGNVTEAHRVFAAYTSRMEAEFGVVASPAFYALLGGHRRVQTS
jgi:DNA-binding SARP family transcriptional activator